MLLIDENELAAEALAADPDAPLGDDAVSLWELDERETPDLPEWYMPSFKAGGPHLRGWKRNVAWMLIMSFVLINAYGMCSTYGWVGLA